jgi:predicted  nucleic acid-binding Zn-ribbon protein
MSEDNTQNLTTDGKLDLILRRLTALENNLAEFRAFAEPRLQDTRPLHDQTRAAVMELSDRITGVEKELRMLGHKMEVLNENSLDARADVRDLKQRVEDLERPRQ